MLKKNFNYLFAITIYAGLIVLALLFTVENPRYDLIFLDFTMLVEGFFNTLWISLYTLLLSMVFGFVLFLLERSTNGIARAFAVVFNEIIMGTPLLIMIFLAVYVIGDIIAISDKLLLGILALTLYMAPYLSNAYKTAVSVVDEDQYVIMNLYHFNGYEKYRYIIIPQMIKPLLPSLLNNLSSIIKGSALLKIVSISEIAYVLTVISSKNWAAVEGYYTMWIMYLMITIPLSILAKLIAKKVTI